MARQIDAGHGMIAIPFWLLLIFLGSYFILNLNLAVIMDSYIKYHIKIRNDAAKQQERPGRTRDYSRPANEAAAGLTGSDWLRGLLNTGPPAQEIAKQLKASLCTRTRRALPDVDVCDTDRRS